MRGNRSEASARWTKDGAEAGTYAEDTYRKFDGLEISELSMYDKSKQAQSRKVKCTKKDILGK